MADEASLTQTLIDGYFGHAFRWARGFTSTHNGIDLSADIGTPAYALTGGTVVFAENAGGGGSDCLKLVGKPCATSYQSPSNPDKASANWATGGGNTVIIQDANGLRYVYAHLDKIIATPGTTIVAGQQIGVVGQTGDATGPHLHLSIIDWTNRKYIDPVGFIDSMFLNWLKAHPYGGNPYPILGDTTTNPENPFAAATTNLPPGGLLGALDITGAVIFIGVILVGVALLFLSGQLAKVKISEAST